MVTLMNVTFNYDLCMSNQLISILNQHLICDVLHETNLQLALTNSTTVNI